MKVERTMVNFRNNIKTWPSFIGISNEASHVYSIESRADNDVKIADL